jgi:hypothetical protein
MKHWNELNELESAVIRVGEFKNLFKLLVAGTENYVDIKVLQSAIYTLETMIDDIDSTLHEKYETVVDAVRDASGTYKLDEDLEDDGLEDDDLEEEFSSDYHTNIEDHHLFTAEYGRNDYRFENGQPFVYKNYGQVTTSGSENQGSTSTANQSKNDELEQKAIKHWHRIAGSAV